MEDKVYEDTQAQYFTLHDDTKLFLGQLSRLFTQDMSNDHQHKLCHVKGLAEKNVAALRYLLQPAKPCKTDKRSEFCQSNWGLLRQNYKNICDYCAHYEIKEFKATMAQKIAKNLKEVRSWDGKPSATMLEWYYNDEDAIKYAESLHISNRGNLVAHMRMKAKADGKCNLAALQWLLKPTEFWV